jgi:hypothetical protein
LAKGRFSLGFDGSVPGPRRRLRISARSLCSAAVAACAALVPALGTGGVASANTLLPLVESFRTPELAAELMAELRLRAPPHLADRAAVRLTYLEGKGTWYRVVIEPPTSRTEVKGICASLLGSGFRHCTPVTPGAPLGAYQPYAAFLPFVGSFENRESAERTAAAVWARAGHLLVGRWATVRLADVPELGWRYRVVIGPRATQAEAEQVCASLWRAGFDACFPIVE